MVDGQDRLEHLTSKSLKQILLFITPFIAFGVVIGVNALSNPLTASEIGIFSLLIVIQIIGFYLAKDNAIKIMTIFSALGVIAMLIGIFGSGQIALFAFLTGGLFCSIMWPCIFSLSITGLGKYTSQGSSFLVMMILGGAIIPPLQGKLADIFLVLDFMNCQRSKPQCPTAFIKPVFIIVDQSSFRARAKSSDSVNRHQHF